MGQTSKTCCFTGHRFISRNEKGVLYLKLRNELISLIEKGVIYFGAGGALGFDTLAAETVIELRKTYTHIKLILILPCRDQAKFWKSDDVMRYEYIKEQADKVIYTSAYYEEGCMLKRNRHLVDNSKYCIAYQKNKRGGTAYTVDYAEKQGKIVINLA